MPLTHVDEDKATLIAEAIFFKWSYPKIRQAGFARTDPEISLIVKEMQAQNITINREGMAEIHSWDVVRPKGGYPRPTTEKKTETRITDPSHINRIAGLGDNPKEIKTGGEVNTSEIIKAQNEFLTNEMKLALDVGIFTLTILRHDVQLTKEQALNIKVTKELYHARLESSHLLGHDVHALDRERAENIIARAAINELQAMVDLYRDGFNSCAANICVPCRTKVMHALNMRARLNGIEVEIPK